MIQERKMDWNKKTELNIIWYAKEIMEIDRNRVCARLFWLVNNSAHKKSCRKIGQLTSTSLRNLTFYTIEVR